MAVPTALKALTVLYVLAVLAADQAEGRHHRPDCPPFSCGHLQNVSSPFRQASDPPGCGYQSYELGCSDTKATIRINNATYYLSGINYSDSTFWVLQADLDLYNSCPLPQWNRPFPAYHSSGMEIELDPLVGNQASFLKCSREVKDNGMYMPVACLSTNGTYVYVLTGYDSNYMEYLEPFCGYLAMTPLPWGLDNASYADVVISMRSGFAIQFPYKYDRMSITDCPRVAWETQFLGHPIPFSIEHILLFPGDFLESGLAVVGYPVVEYPTYGSVKLVLQILPLIPVVCRFVLAPLAVLIFLVYKYWKTIITIDAVEKFLQMQQMLGPRRYAYTDITAITGHFRDKLGQGGYGSVYKGVLLPGNVHVVVKMLEGNSTVTEKISSVKSPP